MSDEFFSERVPSTSFAGDPPIEWEGEILELTKKQATNFKTGEPENWPDGNPKMQGWITLQTDVRDPEIEDDDGRRVMVLDSKNKRQAVQEAVKDSGKKISIGGRLGVEYYGRDTVNARNPDNPPKLYRATYTPPSEASTPTNPPQVGVQASTATATVAGQTTTPSPVTSGAGVPEGHAANVEKLVNAGLSVAGKTPEQVALIAAAL